MTLEELIQQGKTKEDILKAVSAAYDAASASPEPTPEPTPAPAPTSAPAPTPAPAPAPALEPPADLNEALKQLTQMQMQTNQQIIELQKQIIENSKHISDPAPEPAADDARKFSDEALTAAMQKLNLLTENDKIDINKQVEDNLTKHFGNLIGVSVDAGKE